LAVEIFGEELRVCKHVTSDRPVLQDSVNAPRIINNVIFNCPDFKYFFLWPVRFIFNAKSMDLLNQFYATHSPQYLGLQTDIFSIYTTLNAFRSE
jgi:hypothetical protein